MSPASEPSEYVAIEWVEGQQTLIHIVERPALIDRRGSTAARIMDNFRERIMKARFPKELELQRARQHMRYFSVKPKWEWDQDISHSRASMSRILGENWVDPVTSLPRIHHPSVQDFLKYIGWNSKNGKLS